MIRYRFTLGRGPVRYKSKQQTCVALSTCEVWYYLAADATKEGIHLRHRMGEIVDEPVSGIITIWEGSHSAMAYSQNAMVREKTKHILKDHVESGALRLRYLPTDRMVADMFTESLPCHALARHRSAIMGGADPMQRFIS
jgi:hypothetical protein